MKKNFLLVLAVNFITPSFSQGGNPGNVRLGINFWGFNSGTPGDLQIRNNFNQPINIFTSAIQKATFTANFSLGATTIIPGVGTGDGLRITPRTSGNNHNDHPF